jgi:hypothetical protein
VAGSPESPKRSYGRGPGRPGVTEIEVVRAAETLLREGRRPTVAAVRERTGGSNATVAPLLDAWWRSFSSRIAAGPAAFERIPGALAHVAEALWLQTLSEARARAHEEMSSRAQQREHEKTDLEVRSHVLTLREAELEERLRKSEQGHSELDSQIRTLTVLLRKEQANTAAAERRVMLAQTELARAKSRAPPRMRVKERPKSPKARTTGLPRAKRRPTGGAAKMRAR